MKCGERAAGLDENRKTQGTVASAPSGGKTQCNTNYPINEQLSFSLMACAFGFFNDDVILTALLNSLLVEPSLLTTAGLKTPAHLFLQESPTLHIATNGHYIVRTVNEV